MDHLLAAVSTLLFPFIASVSPFWWLLQWITATFFGRCPASKSFNMLKPCFILLFSAVSKHLSFQIASCAYRKAYTNQESVQIFKIFPDFYRLSEGYQFHLLGRNPCFYGLGSGGHPTSLFFSIVKLLPSVNHSSSAFGRGLLPRCGDGNVLCLWFLYSHAPEVWSMVWTWIDLPGYSHSVPLELTKSRTWYVVPIVIGWPNANFSSSFSRDVVAATACGQGGHPSAVWSNCLFRELSCHPSKEPQFWANIPRAFPPFSYE